MTLQQLRYIVEISKYNSISKAARSLFIAQPSISKAVKGLEQELSITIFDRISTGIQFTPEGLDLLCYAKQLLEQVETIQLRFSGRTQSEGLYLSVSAQHYVFTVEAFIQLVKRIQNEPFELHIREGKTSQVIEDVFTLRSSIGIIFLSGSTDRFLRRLLTSKGIEFHPLREMFPHVFLSCRHPLAGQTSVRMEQLADYPCIAYEQERDSLNFAEEAIPTEKSAQTIYVTDRFAMTNILRNTLGYNVGTGCLLKIQEDGIVSIPIEGPTDRMQIGWLKLKDRAMQPEMSDYVQLLHDVIDACIIGNDA